MNMIIIVDQETQHYSSYLCACITENWLISKSFSAIEGPVEIGMSLDIASIDAISEINMVY